MSRENRSLAVAMLDLAEGDLSKFRKVESVEMQTLPSNISTAETHLLQSIYYTRWWEEEERDICKILLSWSTITLFIGLCRW